MNTFFTASRVAEIAPASSPANSASRPSIIAARRPSLARAVSPSDPRVPKSLARLLAVAKGPHSGAAPA